MHFDKEMCNPQHDRSMRNPTQASRQRRSANSDVHFLHTDIDCDGKTGRSSSAQRNRQQGTLPRMKRQDSGFYGNRDAPSENNDVQSSSRSAGQFKRQNLRRAKLGQKGNSWSSNDSTRSSSDSSRSSLESIGTEKTYASTSSSIMPSAKPGSSHSVSSRRSKCSLTSSNFIPQNDLLHVRRRPLKKPHRQASESRLDLNPERRPRNARSTSSRLHSSMPNFSHSDLTDETIMEDEEEEEADCSSEQQFISLPFVLTQKHITMIEDRRSKKLTSRCMMEISEKLNIPLFYSSSRGFEFVPKNISDTQAITDWLSGNTS